jgi:hypothetical protein
LAEKESIQAYASSMESLSGISAQVWECVVEDTSLHSWVVTGTTGAFEDPEVVGAVFDALFGACDARDDVEAYLTEWLIETAGTPAAFAECMSTGLFAAAELEEVARRTAMSALVGVSMAEEVTGEIVLTDAGQASYDQLLSRCEA